MAPQGAAFYRGHHDVGRCSSRDAEIAANEQAFRGRLRLAPLVQTAVCLPAFGERIYRAILLMPVARNWSMHSLGDVLRRLALIATMAYGLELTVGLPILWGLRRLGYLSAPVVIGVGIAAGSLILAAGAIGENDRFILALGALVGGAVAAGPLTFSIFSLSNRRFRGPANLDYETALLAHLHRAGIAVGVPVSDREGRLWSTHEAPEGPRELAVFERLDGRSGLVSAVRRAGKADEQTLADVAALGASLALINQPRLAPFLALPVGTTVSISRTQISVTLDGRTVTSGITDDLDQVASDN